MHFYFNSKLISLNFQRKTVMIKKELITILAFFVFNITAMENIINDINEKVPDKPVQKVKPKKKKKPKYITINNKTPNEIEIKSRITNQTHTIAARKNYKIHLKHKTDEMVFECPYHESIIYVPVSFDDKSIDIELRYDRFADTYNLIALDSNVK